MIDCYREDISSGINIQAVAEATWQRFSIGRYSKLGRSQPDRLSFQVLELAVLRWLP